MERKEQMQKWAENYPEVKRWLTKIQAKQGATFDLWRFCEWAGKQPPELLALKDNPASKDAERLLDTFVADEKTGLSNSAKYRITIAVKSFFKHNYKDLARASGAISLEKVKPLNKPRKEDLRKLWSWALNLRDKALITFVNSTAIAKETLANLKWAHLEENWQNVELPCINIPSKLLKGHGRGKYKGVRQVTFLTPEAKRDLMNYKEWMEQKLGRKLTNEDNIWLEICYPFEATKYANLGTIILKLTKRTNVKFSWHDARRYVNTAMEEIRMPSNWARKIRGRKVKGEEAPYSLPAINQLREKFREAVPILQFTSEKPPELSEKQRRIQAILDNARMLGKSEDEIERIRTMVLRKGISVEEVIEMVKPKNESNAGGQNDCADGEHCEPAFKEIGEGELLKHLQDGWHIAHSLQNGSVIIRKG
jgi:hypothetical protein